MTMTHPIIWRNLRSSPPSADCTIVCVRVLRRGVAEAFRARYTARSRTFISIDHRGWPIGCPHRISRADPRYEYTVTGPATPPSFQSSTVPGLSKAGK